MGRTFRDLLCSGISAPLQSGGGLCRFSAMPRELGQLFPHGGLIALTLKQCWNVQGG